MVYISTICGCLSSMIGVIDIQDVEKTIKRAPAFRVYTNLIPLMGIGTEEVITGNICR